MVLNNMPGRGLPFVLTLFFFALPQVQAHSFPDTVSKTLSEYDFRGELPSDADSDAEQLDDFYEFVENWHRNRIEVLKSEKGWLRLVGLHWLTEGEQSFGSGEGARVRFPEGSIPGFAGIFKLEADTVTMQVAGNINIRDENDRLIRDGVIYTPDERKELKYRGLTWFVVRRDDEFGIRLFDDNSPYLVHFDGIERYEVDRDWRVEAEFSPVEDGTSMMIENVLGEMDEWDVAGTLTFSVNSREVSILALGTGDRLFIPFADATSGIETYTIGRYVYIDRPKSGMPAIIDFNVSYNPPCAMNPNTSCPLPPPQNRLDFPIRAGEKHFEMFSGEN